MKKKRCSVCNLKVDSGEAKPCVQIFLNEYDAASSSTSASDCPSFLRCIPLQFITIAGTHFHTFSKLFSTTSA